ncbi:hypothetical protein [Paradesulfitobacterium ferrireducens]|uniref:hypothetical protein n=1 Tax=Paradesulfitobacterium ferrireducens TaxID=2816476 RepID=UPI001A8E15D9|nr:hypothetical protein [Paradesulfitobacterium ferrireducens]
MDIFEALMLLCFGAAWPFSIYRSYKSGSVNGKSPFFLIVVIIGYTAGILHKVLYSYDFVLYLYFLNIAMVATDLLLYVRNSKMFQHLKSPALQGLQYPAGSRVQH